METLIPQEWFTTLTQPLLILILIGGLAILIKGADLLVGGVAGIAYRLRISKAVVAATVLSLGTTSPETAVSVSAAWSGEAGLALGNAVGSVICNAALIFGLGSVMVALPADRFVLLRQGAWQFGAGLLLSALCLAAFVAQGSAAGLARWSGSLLLVLLVFYIILSIRWGRQHSRNEPFHPEQNIGASPETETRPMWRLILVSLGGLLLVLVASRIFVADVTVLSEVHWHIPKVVVAATIVSVGTSLPELVVSLTSVYKGHGEMLVGNVIGANVLNILWVTGAAASVAPLPLLEPEARHPGLFLWLHIPVMLLVLLLFSTFIVIGAKRQRFPKGAGWPLLAIYVGYVVLQLVLS